MKVKILREQSNLLVYFVRYTPCLRFPNGKQVIKAIGICFCGNQMLEINKQEFIRRPLEIGDCETKYFDIWELEEERVRGATRVEGR